MAGCRLEGRLKDLHAEMLTREAILDFGNHVADTGWGGTALRR